MPETAEKSRISKGISLTDEAFVRNRTANYHLSVQVGYEGLSHAVLDTRSNCYIALESYSFQGVHNPPTLAGVLRELIQGNAVLNNIFKSVQAAVINERSTLIPNALFVKGKEKEYLRFNHFITESDEVLMYDLKGIEAKNIFAMPGEIHQLLLKYYPNAKFNHHSSPLLESLLTTYRNDSQEKLFVHVQAGHFEAVVMKGKELRFYNSFRYQASEDFIYYLLYVCDQLKLNPETIELILLGEVERHSALYSIVYKYIRNVKFGSRSEQYAYAHGFTDLPAHFHYNLLNQYLCV